GAISDSHVPQNPPDQTGVSETPRRKGLVGRCIRAFHQRRAQKQKESSEDRASRRTANATMAIAVFTAVTVIVGTLQWIALSSTDDKIARQAEDIRGQLDQMKVTSDLTRESNRINREAFTAVQRAFIVFTFIHNNSVSKKADGTPELDWS